MPQPNDFQVNHFARSHVVFFWFHFFALLLRDNKGHATCAFHAYPHCLISFRPLPFGLKYENGGFLKWGTPNSSISMGFSTVNQPFWIPPFIETPKLEAPRLCFCTGTNRAKAESRRRSSESEVRVEDSYNQRFFGRLSNEFCR